MNNENEVTEAAPEIEAQAPSMETPEVEAAAPELETQSAQLNEQVEEARETLEKFKRRREEIGVQMEQTQSEIDTARAQLAEADDPKVAAQLLKLQSELARDEGVKVTLDKKIIAADFEFTTAAADALREENFVEFCTIARQANQLKADEREAWEQASEEVEAVLLPLLEVAAELADLREKGRAIADHLVPNVVHKSEHSGPSEADERAFCAIVAEVRALGIDPAPALRGESSQLWIDNNGGGLGGFDYEFQNVRHGALLLSALLKLTGQDERVRVREIVSDVGGIPVGADGLGVPSATRPNPTSPIFNNGQRDFVAESLRASGRD